VELKGFAIRAYCSAVNSLLRDAVKAGQAEFTIPALAELFSEAKREFSLLSRIAGMDQWLCIADHFSRNRH
jgi:hypothetical protein